MPSDLPGILFLQVPENWVINGDQLGQAVEGAIRKLFRNSKRIIAVVVFWEEWLRADGGALLRLMKYREWINEQSRFYSAGNRHLILSYDEHQFVRPWQSLREMAASAIS
jgi:hypothetical protein